MQDCRSVLNRIMNARPSLISGLVVAVVAIAPPVGAQPGPGPLGPGPGCNLFPAPASIGAAVDLSYFGPPPSETNPSLVGPVQLLKSGTIDLTAGTITLPLYKGFLKPGAPGGNPRTVWYVLTDVNDPNIASFLGINYAAKLGFAGSSARRTFADSAPVQMTCADFSDYLIESYAMGRLAEPDLANFETHLLVCPACKDRLAEADQFLRAIREALWRTEPKQ